MTSNSRSIRTSPGDDLKINVFGRPAGAGEIQAQLNLAR